jgi:ABC-type multidrug transport system ATPase subunit
LRTEADLNRWDAAPMHSLPPSIEVSGLVKSFGAVRALDGVELEVAPGTVLAVLGPNDAGKTTLLRILSGALSPDAGTASVARPPVLLLDEPTRGLDPRSRVARWEAIEARAAAGATVLLVTHDLAEAERLADRIAVLDHGRVIAEGTADELKASAGGERLEILLADPDEALEAAWALGGTAEIDGRSVRLPVERGGLLEAARRLGEARLRVDDLALRRPTLDDVFLSLTRAQRGALICS